VNPAGSVVDAPFFALFWVEFVDEQVIVSEVGIELAFLVPATFAVGLKIVRRELIATLRIDQLPRFLHRIRIPGIVPVVINIRSADWTSGFMTIRNPDPAWYLLASREFPQPF